jgi:hypothetical protein
MAELKRNETEHSRRQSSWYYNHYKKNYYLEHMISGTMGSNSTFIAALRDDVPSAMMRCVKNKHPSSITEDTLPLVTSHLNASQLAAVTLLCHFDT